MKIIFLDVEDTLTNKESSYRLNKTLQERLTQIIEATNAYISIISYWRKPTIKETVDYINNPNNCISGRYKLSNVDRLIMSPSKARSSSSILEVHNFIKNNKVDSFVVLGGFFSSIPKDMMPYYVRLNSTQGLTREDMLKVIKLLNDL